MSGPGGWGAVSDTAFIVGRRVNAAATSSSRRQESDVTRHLNKFSPLRCWAGVKGTVVGSDVLECAIGPLLCWAEFGTCSIVVEL